MFRFVSFVLISLLFVSCGSGTKKDKDPVAVDTSISKLSSPELLSINDSIREDPGNPDLYYRRGKIYFANRDVEAAKNDALRAIKLDSLKPSYYMLLSDAYFNANETRASKEALERCVANNPGSIDANLKLAELYFYVKKYENAITYVNNALKINENTAKGYFIKGMCYKESGDTALAISSFQTTVEQDGEYLDAYLELGALLTAKKNPLALEYLNAALRAQPDNLDIAYNIAMYYQTVGKYTEAMDMYKKILSKDINYKHAHYNMGAIEMSVNENYKQAIRYFSNAINADVNYADAYFARGVCYEDLKDKTNAIADYEMAIQLEPNHPFAVQNLNRLEKGH